MTTRILSTTTLAALLLVGGPVTAAAQEDRPAPSPGGRSDRVDHAPAPQAPSRVEAPVPVSAPSGGYDGPASGSTGSGQGYQTDVSGSAPARGQGSGRASAWADQGHRAVPRGTSSSSSSSSSGGSRVASGGGSRSAHSSSGTSVRSGSSSGRGSESSATYSGGGRDRNGGSGGYAYSRPRDGRPVTGSPVARTGGGYYPPYYPGWGGGYWGDYYWYPGWGYYGWWPYWDFGWAGAVGFAGSYAEQYPDDLGSVRLRIKPRDAAVHVDGYYVGIVDEFDGTFQKLRVDVGPHVITVKKPGFAPLEFKVRVVYDHTLTLQGEMVPEGPGRIGD